MRVSGADISSDEEKFMRRALHLARRGYGSTSPNPMVGAVIVRDGKILGQGYHRRAGEAHAEARALRAARGNGHEVRGATIYVTLEPCSTFGRTPPCTDALIESGIKRVVVGAADPNKIHAGRGFKILRKAGLQVETGLLREECERLNEAFNHWIVRHRPFVACKCAMSLDGKIATNSGESRWITGDKARAFGMKLRIGADAIVVGVNTILRDDPALTLRAGVGVKIPPWKSWMRVVLDPNGRIPESARVLNDETAAQNTIVIVTSNASARKVAAIERRVKVVVAPSVGREIKLSWVLECLEKQGVTSLLVEGGGETHYSFLRQGLVNRVYFFYAPLVITGRNAPKAIGGETSFLKGSGLRLQNVEWSRVGTELLCTALLHK